jgi:response regulator RpfG family c-di-GMP phosphodiesterase
MNLTQEKKAAALESLYHWHTVLIIDDDQEVLSALRRVLDREPYDVVTTDRPALALDWMTRKTVSLVISDQRMPEMDGDALLEEVWSRSPMTGRLLLTGHPDQVDRIAPARKALLSVMFKPWDDLELKRRIRTLLREREGSHD